MLLLCGPRPLRLVSGVTVMTDSRPNSRLTGRPSLDLPLSALAGDMKAASGDDVKVPALRCPSPRQSTLVSGRTRHTAVTGLTGTWNCDDLPPTAADTCGGIVVYWCWWTFGVGWPGGVVLVDDDDDEVGQLDDVWLSLSSTSTAVIRDNLGLRSLDDFVDVEDFLAPITGRVAGESASSPRASSCLLTNWRTSRTWICSNCQSINCLSTVFLGLATNSSLSLTQRTGSVIREKLSSSNLLMYNLQTAWVHVNTGLCSTKTLGLPI